jgi:hypothetical protein
MKKACFMCGLNTKLQTMMTTCQNATYYEAVNIAIAWEEKNRKHKEAKEEGHFFLFLWSRQKAPQNHLSPIGPQALFGVATFSWFLSSFTV